MVVPYALLSVFATQQKFCVRDFRGSSQLYALALGYFMAATTLFALGYLVAYGIKVRWWAPFALFAIGLIAWIPTLFTEKIIPTFVWGILSFAGVPICAYLLIRALP